MQFSFVGAEQAPDLAWLAEGLRQELTARGHQYVAEPVPDIRLVFNFIDRENPRPYRRRGQATFVVGVGFSPEVPGPDETLQAGYPLLVRSLSNLFIHVSGNNSQPKVDFITLEQGAYSVEYRADDEAAFYKEVVDRLSPLASSQLVVNNEYVPDLPEELWQGDEITEQLIAAGRRLDALDLLPAPFPIEEILPPEDFRHVQRLYGLGGLSYGNLSARRDRDTFWMSASGVNKAKLKDIGRDVLLVTDYDEANKAMVLSVPPDVKPRRVSVDAIEHWMIYKEHPEVGAIVHVHAWMEGIASTEVNYPCGTLQLAEAVAELVRQAPDPSRAVIGLRNHGLTVTGHNLEDIFDRLEGNIIRQVPMT